MCCTSLQAETHSLVVNLTRKLQHAKIPRRYLGTAASPHLRGEAVSPLGPPPDVSLEAAAGPAALFSRFSSWRSRSQSPVSLSKDPSAESAEKSAAVLCRAQPGKQQKRHEKSWQSRAGDLITPLHCAGESGRAD